MLEPDTVSLTWSIVVDKNVPLLAPKGGKRAHSHKRCTLKGKSKLLRKLRERLTPDGNTAWMHDVLCVWHAQAHLKGTPACRLMLTGDRGCDRA